MHSHTHKHANVPPSALTQDHTDTQTHTKSLKTRQVQKNELCIVTTSWQTQVYLPFVSWSSLVRCGPLEVTLVVLLFEVILEVLSWTLRHLCWKLFFLLYEEWPLCLSRVTVAESWREGIFSSFESVCPQDRLGSWPLWEQGTYSSGGRASRVWLGKPGWVWLRLLLFSLPQTKSMPLVKHFIKSDYLLLV